MIKNLPANAGDAGDEFDPWVWKILRRGKWKPTPVFLLGNSHGRRSLAGYSPRGCKESDMTDGADTHTHTHTHIHTSWLQFGHHTANFFHLVGFQYL